MGQLTPQQTAQLSRQFFSVARQLTQYREQHWYSLTPEQHQRLSKLQWSIYNYTDDLLALSAVLAFEEIEGNLIRIEHITRAVNEYIQNENKVEKVIEVAAKVVVLGGAVLSQSPLAVVSTLADLASHLR